MEDTIKRQSRGPSELPVWDTPQYYHNVVLDVLAKVGKCVPYTFFLTFYAAEFKWVAIMQVLARHYGKQLYADQVQSFLGMRN